MRAWGEQSIDRLITAGWGVPLAENAPTSAYILSPRLLELVRDKNWGTSAVETGKKWVVLHTTSIMQGTLYTTVRCTRATRMRVTLPLGGTFAARLRAPRSRNALVFLLLLRFAPTHVCYRELSVHSLGEGE
jgi:hypothetical protein